MRALIAIMIALAPAAALAEEFRLRMPQAMMEAGLDKHLLTRFRFKTRIAVTPVAPDAEAEAALMPGDDGRVMFRALDGTEWRLARLGGAEGAVAAFSDWLRSDPGRAAVEAFAPDGQAMFTTEASAVAAVAEEVFDADTAAGGKLAILHCGRCHVVDERNRMGGIGSTPSFAALRGRPDWASLFRAFYTANPHPSFTVIDGITAPQDTTTLHIAPVEMSLEDVEAITAFVATLEPKNLGRPVAAN